MHPLKYAVDMLLNKNKIIGGFILQHEIYPVEC